MAPIDPMREPIQMTYVGDETDAEGNVTSVYEVSNETAEMFIREDLESAKQWRADIQVEYAQKLRNAEAQIAQYQNDLDELLRERS